VYAEFSAGFLMVEEVDAIILELSLAHAQMPLPALFMAAKAHQRYRAAGGTRISTLPDFFIGAHAAVAGIPLLTRDTRHYKTYFPSLDLISP